MGIFGSVFLMQKVKPEKFVNPKDVITNPNIEKKDNKSEKESNESIKVKEGAQVNHIEKEEEIQKNLTKNFNEENPNINDKKNNSIKKIEQLEFNEHIEDSFEKTQKMNEPNNHPNLQDISQMNNLFDQKNIPQYPYLNNIQTNIPNNITNNFIQNKLINEIKKNNERESLVNEAVEMHDNNCSQSFDQEFIKNQIISNCQQIILLNFKTSKHL